MPEQSTTRPPKFLAEALHAKVVEPAAFKRLNGEVSPSTENSRVMATKVETPPVPEQGWVPQAPVEAPMPAPSPLPVAAHDVSKDSERLVVALENFRLHAEHLAEQARSDALEIGFQVAKRILEIELSTSPEPLFALIRSAVQRVGESRKVTVRLCPSDLSRVDSAGGKAAVGLSVAQLELISDSALSPGDCVVEGDFGAVDGRISTRLEELKRTVAHAVEGETA